MPSLLDVVALFVNSKVPSVLTVPERKSWDRTVLQPVLALFPHLCPQWLAQIDQAKADLILISQYLHASLSLDVHGHLVSDTQGEIPIPHDKGKRLELISLFYPEDQVQQIARQWIVMDRIPFGVELLDRDAMQAANPVVKIHSLRSGNTSANDRIFGGYFVSSYYAQTLLDSDSQGLLLDTAEPDWQMQKDCFFVLQKTLQETVSLLGLQPNKTSESDFHIEEATPTR